QEALFKPWQSLADKAPLCAARRRATELRRQTALAFAETTKLLEAAIVAEPENAAARTALADLWRGRLDDAERRGAADDAAHAEGDGTLDLVSDPPGARVSIVKYEDRDGVLVPGAERDLGQTPLSRVVLPMGSYLCVLRRAGFPDVRYPVHVTRNRSWSGR